jgi:tetratricopeptide (TPR) repeat protein
MTPRSLASAALLSALLLPAGPALGPSPAAAAEEASARPAAGASLAAVAPRALAGIFARLDTDSDGFLSPAEWGRHAHRVSDGPRDPDGDGKISLDEFSQSFLAMGNLDQVLPRMRLLWRGKVSLERGLAAQALAVYCSASHQFPGCGVGHLGRGRCLESLGQLPAAREAFARATVESPEDAEAWLNLALVDWRLGQTDPAEISLDKGLTALERIRWLPENTPGFPEELAHARYLLDCVRLRLGRGPDAASLLQRLERWQEANLWLATRREAPAPDPVRQAVALAKQGWHPQALEKLRQAAASPHAGWWPRLASASLEELLGCLADARKSATDARALGAPPAQVEVVELGIELAAGETSRAQARLARLREAGLPATAREALGWQLIRHGMPGAALEWLEAADWMRNSDRTLLLLAVCCVLEGKFDRAAAYLGRLPGPPPGEPPMLTALAWAAARCNRFSQALSALDEATGQEPRDAGNWLRLALFCRDTGLTDQVVPHLEEGLAVASTASPDWPSLVFALGSEMLRRELGRLEPRAAAGWLAGQLERLPVTR